MPQPEEIVKGLTNIANAFMGIAIIWHFIFYLLILVLSLGWRPTNRLFSSLISLPLFSVSILAWVSGNPFNGIVFGMFGLLLIILGLKNSFEKVKFPPLTYKILAILIITYGLIYPHFLQESSFLHYIFVSPLGLVPCPTLSTIIGFAILFSGFLSKRWSIILIIIGSFYGLFGMFRLNVWLDSGLLLANIILFIQIYSIGGKDLEPLKV